MAEGCSKVGELETGNEGRGKNEKRTDILVLFMRYLTIPFCPVLQLITHYQNLMPHIQLCSAFESAFSMY